MAAAAARSASGSAMLLCFLLSGRVPVKDEEDGGGGGGGGERKEVRMRGARGVMKAPETWWGEVAAAGASVRFVWLELMWKWPFMDLVFGVKYLMKRRGNLPVASVYAGRACVQLKGHVIMSELIHMLRLLNICIFLSKKSFRVFLSSFGYSQDDVLLRVSKSGILKPAFTILCDRSSNCFLLVIRGMHSINDMLTAYYGPIVPFHHSFLHKDGVNKSVRGYAHCGMAAAAHWIAKRATPCLLDAVNKYPDYSIKVVGSSLGGGAAALLAYILREREEFSSCTCVSFAPAACVTWEIAESGKDFITTIINRSDQVPSCSITSINNLRSEISSSSWLSDLWLQVRYSRFLSVVNCFTSSSRTNQESRSSARVEEAVGADPHSVPAKTRDPMKCTKVTSVKEENAPDGCTISREDAFSLVVDRVDTGTVVDVGCSSSSNCKEKPGEDTLKLYRVTAVSTVEKKTEGELRLKLVKELNRDEEADFYFPLAGEPTEEENTVQQRVAPGLQQPISPDASEMPKFYPPGKIMHMIAAPAFGSSPCDNATGNESIGIYRTPRDLYSKIQLSKDMIKDHYMAVYKETLELLIDSLGKDEDGCTGITL